MPFGELMDNPAKVASAATPKVELILRLAITALPVKNHDQSYPMLTNAHCG